MKLSEEQKKKMTEYYNYISNKMYGNKTKKERQKMGMFFTPSELGIQMLEKFESLTEEYLNKQHLPCFYTRQPLVLEYI